MHRFFGKKKEETPGPTLDETSSRIDARGKEMDAKIKSLNDELVKHKTNYNRLRPGPQKSALQQKMMSILKQKKMYEKQRDSLYGQQFNIDQTRFSIENAKDTANTVQSMKSAQVELKKAYNDLSIDEIEDLHDDMSELMEMNDEVQEIMGRTYGVPEYMDETDLMNELAGLEEEFDMEELDDVPNYLVDASKSKTTQKTKSYENDIVM